MFRYLPLVLATSIGADPLLVYTYDSFASEWGPGSKIEAGFEAECDCDLEFVPAGDGAAILTRLRLEGKNTDADVVLGFDQHLIPLAEDLDIFAPIEQENQVIFGTDIEWSHPHFQPFDWGHFAFVHRTDLKNIPTDFKSLAKSDLKIIIQDPRSSTPGLGLAVWIESLYPEEAAQIWSDLSDNIVSITPGWSEAYTLFLEGASDMVLSYTTSPAYHIIAEEDDGYTVAKFEQGHATQIELAGVLAASDHPKAMDFVTYLQSKEAQIAINSLNWMYPVREIDLPTGFSNPDQYIALPPVLDRNIIEAAKTSFQKGMN